MFEGKFDELTRPIIGVLPLIPVGGVVFSVSYEFAYFREFGTGISYVFEIQDLIRSSILFVLPTLFIIIVYFGLLSLSVQLV